MSKKTSDEAHQVVIIPEDVAAMPYEQARDELISVVAKLEAGGAPLEDALSLWERGEVLAAHCHRWLSQASARTATDDPTDTDALNSEDDD